MTKPNAFTSKPDLSDFMKSAKYIEQKRSAAKTGLEKMTPEHRKHLHAPVMSKEKL